MKVVCSFDDATVQDLKVADLMVKHGLECIFYWPVEPEVANRPKGRRSLNLAQMKNIAALFEVGSHTITHPLLTRIPYEDAVHEIQESKLDLEARFSKPITKFAYPRGYANDQLQKAVRLAGYQSARSTVVGRIYPSENPYFEETTVHVGNDRKDYGGRGWYDFAMNMLLIAAGEQDSVYHLWGHSWEVEQNNGWDELDQLLQALSKAEKQTS